MKYALLLLLAGLQVGSNFILWHKRYSRVSRIFAVLTAGMLVWTAANTVLDYATNSIGSFGTPDHRLDILNLSNRIGFFAGTFMLILFYRLILVFPKPHQSTRLGRRVTVVGTIIAALLALLPIVAGSYTLKENGTAAYHYGAGSALIIAYFIILVVLVLQNLLKSLRQPIDKRVKRQAKTLITGILLTGAWGIIFILIVPVLTKDDKSLFIGYFAPYIFTATLLYSIIRQGFLNFNLIIARSVGYTLSLGVIIGSFLFITLNFIRLISGDSVSFKEAVIFACFNVVTALIFRPTKQFFDRISNGIFYRDAYDSQMLIDKLNRTFVAYTDLDELLKQSANTIQQYIKIEVCSFMINDKTTNSLQIIGPATNHHAATKDNLKVAGLLGATGTKVIVTDNLEEKHSVLHAALQNEGVAVVARLGSIQQGEQAIGSMLLGGKQSGNPYTGQDLRTIETIANELTIAIESSMRFEEIEQFNTTLRHKIDEATHKLRQTNQKLRSLDETKDEFITMASHQLRTPLTSVKGYLSMVLEGDAGKLNKQQEQLLTQSFISSQRMVYLIADLLNLSRLNTGKFVIEPIPVDLREVVQGEIDQLRETAKARNLALLYDRPANFPLLMLDETKIHQVVMNFIDNAIYYTPAGGTIHIELHDNPTNVEYLVKDNGIGVPKREQPHLFTKFYRAGNARKARPDGTGLGLFMAKKVIAAQEGVIVFESIEGKGSTFGFRFAKSTHLAVDGTEVKPHPPVFAKEVKSLR